MTLSRLTLLALAVLVLGGVVSALRDGTPRAYWGTGMRRHEGEGEPGRERGEWTYWYPDGSLRERGHYRRGKRFGTWTQWYPHGQRASSGERVWDERTGASVRHGSWTFWHDNGELRAQGSYQRGARTGLWSYWRLGVDRAVLDEVASGRYEADRKLE